jgi:hypothetical protein
MTNEQKLVLKQQVEIVVEALIVAYGEALNVTEHDAGTVMFYQFFYKNIGKGATLQEIADVITIELNGKLPKDCKFKFNSIKIYEVFKKHVDFAAKQFGC